jgi:hypothetical protein
MEKITKTNSDMYSKYEAQPIPDTSTWFDSFAGWGIWRDITETDESASYIPDEFGLGLLLTEERIASKRILGWGSVFAVLGLVAGIIGLFYLSDLILFAIIASILWGIALYRFLPWYINRDLRVRIFREGFTVTKRGKTTITYWRDIDFVREYWHKMIIQGIFQIHNHNVNVIKSNGETVKLDLTLNHIEKIGRLIQLAAAEYLSPIMVERLKSGDKCEFGPFKIDRYGIYKEKEFLPWEEVKSLDVNSVGSTTLHIKKESSHKLSIPWATKPGKAVPNLLLFITFTSWFIEAAKHPVSEKITFPDTIPDGSETHFQSSVNYNLSISKKEAQDGTQKTLYVGPSKRERRLVVKIPPGVKSGTVYSFPEFGRPNPKNGSPSVLDVVINVEKGQLSEKIKEVQMFTGIILLFGGLIWLIEYSTLDLVTSVVLATLFGGTAGALISTQQRRIGVISGAIGGVISFILNILYFMFIYLQFGRDTFWYYELVIVFILSLLPGIGIYFLLNKIQKKKI